MQSHRSSDSAYFLFFFLQLWARSECQVAATAQGGRRVYWSFRHCGLHGYQIRLEGPQHGAQAGREMPEHGILRACCHPRGFRRPHLCAPSSFPSWVSTAPRPDVTQNKSVLTMLPIFLIGSLSYSTSSVRINKR